MPNRSLAHGQMVNIIQSRWCSVSELFGLMIWLDSSAYTSQAPVGRAEMLKGLLIHPLSIKAWLFVLVSFTTFGASTSLFKMAIYILIFFLSAVVAHLIWMTAGTVLNVHVESSYLHLINQISAVAMMVMVVTIFVA